MAYERLRRYVTERLLDLDSSLSDAQGAPMFEKVIDPLIERLSSDPLTMDIEEFVVERLKNDPLTANLDVESAGSFIKDVIVRPLIILLEPLQREIAQLKRQQSLANLDALSSEELDALMYNLLVFRSSGDVARGTVRVFYTTPQPVAVDAAIVFRTASGLQFIPSEPQSRSESDFVRAGDLYYVEFEVQSVVAHTGANINEDTVRFVTGLPNVVRVTNPNRFSGGVTEEDNPALYRRALQSVTERSLNAKNAIQSVIFDAFPDVVSIHVVGYRDPEMQRDVLTGTVSTTSTASPGKVTLTSTNLAGLELTGPVPDPDLTLSNWTGTNDLPVTTVLDITFASNAAFLVAWAASSASVYARVFSTGSDYDDDFLTRVRTITELKALDSAGAVVDSSDPTAVKIRVVLADFTIITNGSVGLTNPHTNEHSDQGPDYKLKSTGGNWRGAPLPFTDVFTTSGVSLASYTAQPGKDFLVVRGRTSDTHAQYYFRVFPIKKKLSSTEVQIRRLDHAMVSREQTLGVTYENNPSILAAQDDIQIIDYGAPNLGDPSGPTPADMYDGVTTVTGGKTAHGGVALYEKAADNFAFVELAADSSRPNGWESLGVEVGNFISLALHTVDSTAYTGNEDFDWWQWARITEIGPSVAGGDKHWIKVQGIYSAKLQGALATYATGKDPFGGDPNYFGFPDASPYRLHWTVYRGEMEVVLPNDNIHTAYDDFVYLPAYDTSGVSAGAYNEDASTYFVTGDGHTISSDSGTLHTMPIYRFGSSIQATTNGVALNHRANWAIIRLGENFLDMAANGETNIMEFEPEADRTTLPSALNTLNRYPETDTVGGNPTVTTGTTSFFAIGQMGWDDVGNSVSYTAPGSPNLRAARGLGLPHWIGSSSAEVVQLFEAAETTTTDSVLTISDIPGSYPFPDEFGLPLTVNANEVHVGGMTDVYVKGASPQEESVSLELAPNRLLEGSGNDLYFSATDGQVLASSVNELISTSMSSTYTAAEAELMVGMALEITDSPDSATVGIVARIVEVDHSSSIIRVDTSLDDDGIDTSNIHYRVYQAVTTDLETPKVVYAEGSDLIIPLEDKALYTSSSFDFDSSLIGLLYVEVTTVGHQGEYKILSRPASNKITIDASISGEATGLDYRIYTKQAAVGLPLVRVSKVELSSDLGAGIEVPYSGVIDNVAESFSGLNNDPVSVSLTGVLRPAGTYAGAGAGTSTDPSHAAGTYTEAQFFLADSGSADWAGLGIIPNDVLKVTRASDNEDTYFYVTEVKSSSGLEVLVLDRDLSTGAATESGLSASVGKPSLGDIRCWFLAPTYFEVNNQTVWTTTDGALSFRPSPAESGDLYESGDTTDVVIDPGGSLTSTSLDFHAIGVKAGDVITVGKRVIQSSTLTAASYNDMSSLVGKSLVIEVDGTRYAVSFSSVSGTFSIDSAVSQINSELAGLVRAAAEDDASVPGNKFLKLYSKNSITVRDSSSGVLSTLGLTVDTSNIYTSGLTLSVDSISYAPATTTSVVNVTALSGSLVPVITPEVFISIARPKTQIFYPADMTRSDTGLYYVDVVASSRTAFPTQTVDEGTQVNISGYKSFGYQLIATNSNYTFSAAEEVFINCTPLLLPPTATDMSSALVTPRTDVDVTYERAQVVEDVQSYLLSGFTRVVNNNPLARHYFPAYLHMNVVASGGPSAEELTQEVSSYVGSLFPNKTLEAFDVSTTLYRSGVDYVRLPLDLVFIVHNADRSVSIVRSQNAVTLDKRYHIMENDDNITVVKG